MIYIFRYCIWKLFYFRLQILLLQIYYPKIDCRNEFLYILIRIIDIPLFILSFPIISK